VDPRSESAVRDPIVVTGVGACDLSPGEAAGLDCSDYLKSRKTRKFMGKQDELAVIAAGQALAQAKPPADALRSRTGIYLAVGYIPFAWADIEPLAQHSIRDQRFSMEAFATEGIEQVNPLLTFRCLPNMPIFHVSLNFGIQGPYFVTYPGIGQFYLALERALADLDQGLVDYALLGGTADQNNFLVQWHFSRPSARAWTLHDAAGFVCLEKRSHATARSATARIELGALEMEYAPRIDGTATADHRETFEPRVDPGHRGPASLAVALAQRARQNHAGEFTHGVTTCDGMRAVSRWSFR
jgi:3-oxoacyl-(acyl-carrier-protein) synthase